MEKGLSQLCLWGGRSSAVNGSIPFPRVAPRPPPAPYLQALGALRRLGSQASGGGGGDFPHEAPTSTTAA